MNIAGKQNGLHEVMSAVQKKHVSISATVVLVLLFCLPSDGISRNFCPFFHMTGIECLFCGITRSMSSFLHLGIYKSINYHPLGTLILLLLTITAIKNETNFLYKKITLNKISVTIYSIIIILFSSVGIIRLLAFF